jgi:hypothetical protein
LRRSSRSRRVVFQEGFVPTVSAVPMKGDIPTLDAPSSSTKENNITKPTYQNSLSALLREKRIRDKAGYNINVLEQALENDVNITFLYKYDVLCHLIEFCILDVRRNGRSI